jgi:uncharacterized Zn finger protein (UPF0148 family)
MKLPFLSANAQITLFLTLIFCSDLFARAGGGGGRSSSGGGSYRSSSSSSWSSSGSGTGGSGDGDLFFFFGVLFTVAVVVTIAKSLFKGQQSYASNLAENIKTGGRRLGLDAFKEANPSFSEDAFERKVKRAFLAIQEAWSNKDLTEVRKFISDGVWQRFSVQFMMMDALEQTNQLEHVKVVRTFIDSVESDGDFDTIHVGIECSLHDRFVCNIDSTLNSGGRELFIEYWSFIRKKGVTGKDLYSVGNCPSCSAPLGDKLGEVAQCPYCNAMVNSGEFDWVLSEITQADDYTANLQLYKQENLSEKRAELSETLTDFSVQMIEDRVSNGFMQILAAKTLNQPERVRRFVADSLYENMLKEEIASCDYLYNRLYTNDVSLLAAAHKDDLHYLYIGVTYSSQRVQKAENRVLRIDGTVHQIREVIRVERAGSGKTTGELYMHRCPACSAPVADSLEITCPYCSATLNSAKNEWIISDILTPAEYRQQLFTKESEFDFSVSTEKLDGLLSVKDYVITNIIAMITCDNHVDSKELEYLGKLAKQLNYSKGQQESILRIAQCGQQSVKMPEDMKMRRKIFTLMKKAAEADNRVVKEERELLQFVEERYLQ